MAVTTVRDVREVGPQTIAVELESPSEFEAEPGQFVLIKAPVDGEVESGHYTLSSPVAGATSETTAEYEESGTVG
jgi:ferredoxin-NADP reductase